MRTVGPIIVSYEIYSAINTCRCTFTPILPSFLNLILTGLTGWPTITLVAKAIKSVSKVLETNGNERETRRLHSITLSWLSLAINWILKGPIIERKGGV